MFFDNKKKNEIWEFSLSLIFGTILEVKGSKLLFFFGNPYSISEVIIKAFEIKWTQNEPTELGGFLVLVQSQHDQQF